MSFETATGYTPAPAASGTGAGPGAEVPPAVAPPMSRNPRMIAASIALIVVCALVVGWSFTQATARAQVLAIIHPISYGQQITAADLAIAHVAADPDLAPIPAAQEQAVIGRYVAANVPAGTLLVHADLSATAVPAPGQTVAYVPIADNRLPAGSLTPGRNVQMIYAPSSGSTGTTSSSTAAGASAVGIDGTVLAVASPTSDGTILVTVVIPATDASTVAMWAASESVELTAVTG